MNATTPKGREALAWAEDGLRAIETKFPNVRFERFADESPADVDGVVVERGIVTGIYEVKARLMSIKQFDVYKREWLVSYSKIQRGVTLSKMLHVKMVGVLVLVSDKTVLVQTLVDSEGEIIVPMRIERTATQKCINGGAAVRANAFIDMNKATVLSF